MGKIHPKASKVGALGRTEREIEAEESFFHCPAGHQLPHKTRNGECTPRKCAQPEATKAIREWREKRKALPKDLVPIPTEGVGMSPAGTRGNAPKDDYEEKLAKAQSRLEARNRYHKVPEGLEGEAAEQWADQEIVKLLPAAVARLRHNLLLGDEDQSERAANRIMDATGRGKRDAGGGGSSPIIMLLPNGTQPIGSTNLPWARKVVEVEAKVLGGNDEKK